MIDSLLRGETKRNAKIPVSWTKFRRKTSGRVKAILLDKGLLFVVIGFLLGRAVILSAVSPFAIAFLATIWAVYRSKAPKVMLAIGLGSLTYSPIHSLFTILALIVFILLVSVFKQTEYRHVQIPLFVFLATAAPRLFVYSVTGQLTAYEWMLLSVEGVLGVVLVLIFMQSMPLLAQKKYNPVLKNEEIVCMIILIASILTGTIGWQVYGAALEQVFSRYVVLVLAYVGGAAIGSTVGVVAGLILSLANVANLYQSSLLAFAGLISCLLKEGRKIGLGAGLLVGTFRVGIYGDTTVLIASLVESVLAIGLFLFTPANWFKKLSRYIPGTVEYTDEQEQYLQKIRHVTARRVEQFSDVFGALSKSFSGYENDVADEEAKHKETDYFLSQVTKSTCQTCFMKERCWRQQFDKTYDLMANLKDELAENDEPT